MCHSEQNYQANFKVTNIVCGCVLLVKHCLLGILMTSGRNQSEAFAEGS